MKISELLTVDSIQPNLSATTKDEVLEELVRLAVKKDGNIPVDQVLEAVRQREELMSTGIGNEIGLPHAKTSAVEDLVVVFGRSLQGIDFKALDDKPVRIFFMLLAPENQSGPHVKALAHISRLLKHGWLRDSLLSAADAREILKIIKEEENRQF